MQLTKNFVSMKVLICAAMLGLLLTGCADKQTTGEHSHSEETEVATAMKVTGEEAAERLAEIKEENLKELYEIRAILSELHASESINTKEVLTDKVAVLIATIEEMKETGRYNELITNNEILKRVHDHAYAVQEEYIADGKFYDECEELNEALLNLITSSETGSELLAEPNQSADN